ncbi:hypothetical protein V8G54_005666 [Vigna mungo]|uniref:Uncharacterized protein n=1 Tax=Vigna mungo TaxID=3915 RepID=A0AAQ3NYF5_VIGMU
MTNSDEFTDKTNGALKSAHKIVVSSGHAQYTPRHLVYSPLSDKGGIFFQALSNETEEESTGTTEKVYSQALKRLPSQSHPLDVVPTSPSLIKVINKAWLLKKMRVVTPKVKSEVGGKEGRKVESATGNSSMQVRDKVIQEVNRYFKPKLLNGLSRIVVFDPLSREQLRLVVRLQMKDIASCLAERGITMAVTNVALDYILSESYDPVGKVMNPDKFTDKTNEALKSARKTVVSSGHAERGIDARDGRSVQPNAEEVVLSISSSGHGVSRRTGIPVTRLKQEDKERLIGLADRLHQRVVEQDEVVNSVIEVSESVRQRPVKQ